MYSLVIYQYRMFHYRIELFNMMREMLKEKNIELSIVYGQPNRDEQLRSDECDLSWGIKVRNISRKVAGTNIVWQPIVKKARKADMIIFMQENRILSNYYWMLNKKFDKKIIAMWGHGKNFQSKNSNSIKELWKGILMRYIDWFFAYTDLSKDIVVNRGYNNNKITVLNNSFDTDGFRSDINKVLLDDINAKKRALGIDECDKVCLYCGSLYKHKKIEFLIESCKIIYDSIPNFKLIVLGDGPMMEYLNKQSLEFKWIYILGFTHGYEKALCYKISSLQLNPGLVGLHILDSFVSGVPMVTLTKSLHSPEFSYMKNNVNGFIVDADHVNDYAKAVIDILNDREKLSCISNKCKIDSYYYSVENMADNFVHGICKCLNMYGRS